MRIEVCTATLKDSVTAFEAGASRIELNSALEAGGVSPSPGLLEEVSSAVDIPVMVMARPVSGGFQYSGRMKRAILRDMDLFLQKGADGLVFGALTGNREPDMPFIRRVRKEFPDTVLVFSRAFDLLEGVLSEHVSRLCDGGLDRVLTSGGKSTAAEGAEIIRSLTGKGIDILPGSGISAENVEMITRVTGCGWVHGSFTGSRRPAHTGRIVPPVFPAVDPDEIRRTLQILQGKGN